MISGDIIPGEEPLGDSGTARALGPPDSREAHSALFLLDLSEALHARLEIPAVLEALAEQTRKLFSARMAVVLLNEGASFRLQALSAETSTLAASLRGSPEAREYRFAADLARTATDIGQPVIVPARAYKQDVSAFLGASDIMAAPIHPAGSAPGVLLVYSASDDSFQQSDKSLLAKVCGIASLAVSNAGLYSSADARARESRQLLNLVLEMNSFSYLPEVISQFVERALEIVGARAGALALIQDGRLDLRAIRPDIAPGMQPRLIGALDEALRSSSTELISGPASDILGTALADELGWRQITLARIRGAGDVLMGVLCLADCRYAVPHPLTSLLSHLALALENARQFTRMHEANRHWIEVFDAISDFILVHDQSHRVLRVNRALADFIGVPPQQLIGLTTQTLMSMASAAVSSPCPFCSTADRADEYVHRAFDRSYLVSSSQIRGESREHIQTIHVLKDITDRQEAERRYRELFDTIQEGLFFSTPEGRFVEVNDALVRILGYSSREELLQTDISRQIYLSPEQRVRFLGEIETHGTVRNYEEALRRKDGSIIHSLQNAFAVRNSEGKIVQFRGLMLDITEQKNFQAELQRERDFNSKILNNTQSMILVLDNAGIISYANRRCFEAGGYRQEELIGRRLIDLVPPGRRHALTSAIAENLDGRQVDNLDLPILLGQGRGGQFSVNLSPMRDENGAVASLVVVMTDITDAAMLQAKLMHAEKMAAVGQLVSGVAHEVNNPLTAILGFSDLLLEHPGMPESARKDLRVVMQEAQRTKQIVQNLLSFARQMPPQRSPVQINDIVRRTLALRHYDFASHGVQIIERFDERIPQVIADSHQLQQVFLNILNNAYDAVRETGRPGRIEVLTTRSGNDLVEVSFRDNGSGVLFPDRIFDPFFTTKEVGKGTGLGLSICYGIVREHGGEIFCRNNDDAGATFFVRLPIRSSMGDSTVRRISDPEDDQGPFPPGSRPGGSGGPA